MAGMNSPMPYIKDEPADDFSFTQSGFGNSMNGMGSFNHPQQFGSYHGNMPIDMSDINMGAGLQRPAFGSQQNMASSFIAGNSGIGDDELADLIDYPDSNQGQGNSSTFDLHHNDQMASGQFSNVQGHSAIAMNQQNQFMNNMYGQTPDGPGPIQSPFAHSFNYAQYVMQPHTQSPMQRPSHGIHSGSFDMGARIASLRQDRNGSISKSPMTPKTPNTAMGQSNTPESAAHAGQAIPGSFNRGHTKTASGQWENAVGSAHSYIDSPLASPQSGPVHPQISEVMGTSGRKSGDVAASAPSSSLEAKRQKRRQSHNAVERRRRDNINDRISELARLVPGHRLDDDKIRKHLSSNNPFPPALTNMSPPQASSLLAGGTGRRAVGSISQGLPVDDKDKGPAKGDVLNGAVGWVRDLMWMLNRKIQQESILIETIENLGGSNPLQIREDEQRMQSELMDAIQRNGVGNFHYSRANGTGLWVPNVC